MSAENVGFREPKYWELMSWIGAQSRLQGTVDNYSYVERVGAGVGFVPKADIRFENTFYLFETEVRFRTHNLYQIGLGS